jgi:intracellular septation protein A
MKIDLCDLLTIAVVFFATAFLSFGDLVEVQLLSKTYAFITGAVVCCGAVLLFRKKVEISCDLLTAMVVLLVGYIMLRMGIVQRRDAEDRRQPGAVLLEIPVEAVSRSPVRLRPG